MRAIYFIQFLLCLSAFAAEDGLLRYDGVGLIQFGITLSEAESILKEKAILETYYTPEGCNYIKFNTYKNIDFMVEDNIIVRADAEDQVENSLGILIGESIDSIKSKFPNADIQPNHYEERAHDIWLSNPQGQGFILLYESEGKIRSIRSGVKPAVGYIEGCA